VERVVGEEVYVHPTVGGFAVYREREGVGVTVDEGVKKG
jgi:hypothetical protein